MGATKKICGSKLIVEDFSESYFINYQKYSKDEPTEIFEVIILQNLPKINNVYILNEVKLTLQKNFLRSQVVFETLKSYRR